MVDLAEPFSSISIDNELDLDALEGRLVSLQVAGCTCQTKSPVTRFHDPMCVYRGAAEAYSVIVAFREREKERLDDARGDALDRDMRD